MAEERSEHRGSDVGELHDAGNSDHGQWIDVRRESEQHGGKHDQHHSHADGERGGGCADDYDAAGESDGDGRADGDVWSGGGRDGAAELPVAEERAEHRGSDVGELHDAGNSDHGQWIDVRRGGEQHGGKRDEQSGDADGERGGGCADDYDAAGESDGDGRTDSDVWSGGWRDGAAELPVAEEWSEHRGSDVGELHDAGNSDDG